MRLKRSAFACTLAGIAFVLLVPLAYAQKAGTLRTRIDPPVAGVFVNGDYQGMANMFSTRDRAIQLIPGDYEVIIRDPRYQDLRANVKIEAGRESVIRRRLTPKGPPPPPPYGELKVEGFGNAAVYVDGRYHGNAIEFTGPAQSALLLPPGSYRVTVEPTGESKMDPKEETVDVKADQLTVVRAK